MANLNCHPSETVAAPSLHKKQTETGGAPQPAKQSACSFVYQPPASSTFLSEQISHQPAVLFSQNKSTPAISHQPNEQAEFQGLQHSVAASLATVATGNSCWCDLGRFLLRQSV
jgi:hypothetical protein